MKYRQLGDTGVTVSEIGFGCWGIAGDSYGHTDDAQSKDALRYAVDKGITFFDTSDFYGQGKSESLIGEALKEVRSKVVIATKFGVLEDFAKQDFTATHLEKALDASLKRLQTDYIDLYQLHSPPGDVFESDEGRKLFEKLEVLKSKGKIRAVGVSVRQPMDAVNFIKKHGIKSVQANFNLIDQRIKEIGLFEAARENKAGIIARTPLCFGFLTGQYTDKKDYDDKDQRARWSEAQRKTWGLAIEKFWTEKSNEKSHARNVTKAKFALQFCLAHNEITAAIPGMLNREQIDENSEASGLELFAKEELHKFSEIYKSHSFFLGEKPK